MLMVLESFPFSIFLEVDQGVGRWGPKGARRIRVVHVCWGLLIQVSWLLFDGDCCGTC